MIVYERFKSTAKLQPLALSLVLFKTGPQNRVRAATFATQRRSTTRFQIYIPPFNELVFIFFNSSKKNNRLRTNYRLAILFEYLLPKTAQHK